MVKVEVLIYAVDFTSSPILVTSKSQLIMTMDFNARPGDLVERHRGAKLEIVMVGGQGGWLHEQHIFSAGSEFQMIASNRTIYRFYLS